MDLALERALALCEETGALERGAWGLYGIWGGVIRQWLDELLRRGLAGCPSFGNHQPDHGGGKGQGTAAGGLGLCFFAVENSHGHRDPAILRLAAAIDRATDTLPTMRVVMVSCASAVTAGFDEPPDKRSTRAGR